MRLDIDAASAYAVCMSSFQAGDRVRVKTEFSHVYGNQVGTVVRLHEEGSLTWVYPVEVKLDNHEGSLGFKAHELAEVRKSPVTQELLKRTEEYPKGGVTGFQYSRDELIALLQECSPSVTVGVHEIDHYEPSGDSTSVRITVYATFSRGEVGMPPRKM